MVENFPRSSEKTRDGGKNIKEFVTASWIAKALNTTSQNISLAGRRALNPNYRGDFIKPDATLDEGTPIWLKKKAEDYIRKKKVGK
ncbi:hypothetical protein [Paenibacillus sp. P22]|uniref:hypothetical protein n=1 Tax=Paenibacillus sp. P22 TaxID=483908 RepID=UPI00043530C9|nr:hypothetical protein [Paenibacillus sp. P22]CDN44175.1 hypothetical protein BN871_EI_00040 [Paenibacillus sp. P22]